MEPFNPSQNTLSMIKTDWERYYSNPLPSSVWSRAVVRRNLIRMFRKTGISARSSVAELGGGGSCFCDAVEKTFGIMDYTVYDSCQAGITEFLRKKPNHKAITADLLTLECEPLYDLVFSVGLVEHFPPEQTAMIIRKHFELTKAGGHVILFSPTPTLLYRATRNLAECLNLWQFPDERPLLPEELRNCADSLGTCLECSTVYANFLTQYATLYRK